LKDPYRIFGSELSPYSVKVRSYFRYKDIPHRFLVRNAATQAEFQKLARLPLIPLVVGADGDVLQDSTPILEAFEARLPEPSIHPPEPVAAFVSALLEEFGDEWGNKWMFHYRWARPVDQESAAGRIARAMLPEADEAQVQATTEQIRGRMIGRMGFVGSSERTAAQIERSFREAVELLDAHLAERPYLFGGRPAFGDFGLGPQLYEAWTDPTAGAWIEARAQRVLGWIQRMLWPRALGEFEPWAALEPTLAPLLESQVGRLFLPWSLANAAAIQAGEASFEVGLAGPDGTKEVWQQAPQKYHAKSLAALRQRFAESGGSPELDALLERTGCLAALRA